MLFQLSLLNLASASILPQINNSTASVAPNNTPKSPRIFTSETGIPNKYFVKFRADILPQDGAKLKQKVIELSINQTAGITTDLNISATFNSFVGFFDQTVLDLLAKSPLVEYIEQDAIIYSKRFVSKNARMKDASGDANGDSKSNETETDQQHNETAWNLQENPPWHLQRLAHRCYKASRKYNVPIWDAAGTGVDIYIVDTGVYPIHSDFGNRVKHGWSAFIDSGYYKDHVNHGTCVASVAAGKRAGVAKNANIISIKAFNTSYTPVTVVIAGIAEVIVRHRAKIGTKGFKGSVINLSEGGESPTAELQIIEEAVREGIHVVVAAGNENADACSVSPALSEVVITVGSVGKDNMRSEFSNYGPCVDVYAPGEDIECASYTGIHSTQDSTGTSFASPLVAGVVASVMSYSPSKDSSFSAPLTPAQMKRAIRGQAGMVRGHLVAFFDGTSQAYENFFHEYEEVEDLEEHDECDVDTTEPLAEEKEGKEEKEENEEENVWRTLWESFKAVLRRIWYVLGFIDKQ